MSRGNQVPKCSVASRRVSRLPTYASKPWPKYTRYETIEDFFNKRRKQLLRRLDKDHVLRSRVDNKTGQLLEVPRDLPRCKILTGEDIERYKRRKRRSDPDDARNHLQGSHLVHMWNTNHQSEEHWQDFDRVRKKMVSKQKRLRPCQLTLFIDASQVDERRVEWKWNADSPLAKIAQSLPQDADATLDHQADQDRNYEDCLLSKPLSKEAHEEKEVCREFADMSDSALPQQLAEPGSCELLFNKEVATES